MRKLLTMSTLLLSTVFYAQQATDLPDFTPPSPEAAAITQYGNQEINESTGKVSSTIPLYTYSAGQVQIPISLNYNGNGVKVDDTNTWTGVNWRLNSGGVITRTVYHNPDEDPQVTERVFKDDIDALGLINSEDDAIALKEFYEQSQYDTQPDIFSFSFAGYTGSFYLRDNNAYLASNNPTNNNLNTDNDYQPVLINVESGLKIEIEGLYPDNITNLRQNNEFKITTPDGVEYYFGGIAVEETAMEQDWHSVVTPRAITSYYLTEVKHPIAGSIYLEYDTVSSYTIASSQSRSITRYKTDPELGFYDGCGDPPNCEPLENSDESGYGSTLLMNKVYNGKFLKRIYSNINSQEVFFNANTLSNGGFNVEKQLNSIEIKKGTALIRKIELDYITHYSSTNVIQRFFLERVNINKDLDNDGISDPSQYQKYELEYNAPLELPDRFSASQDALGYYNGKNNEYGLLPSTANLPTDSSYSPSVVLAGVFATADRSTDFNFKTKGALTKIHYPTGGYTLFEYESNMAKKTTHNHVDRKVFINDYPLDGGNGATHNNNPSNSAYLGSLTYPGSTSNYSLFESQDIVIKVELETTAQIGHQRTKLKITNLTDNSVEENDIVMPHESGFNPQFIEHREFTPYFDKDKEYLIELILPDNIPSSIAMRGVMYFDYKTGYGLVEGESLRVKRISDFTNNNATPTNIKRYYYTNINNVFKNPIDYVDVYKEPIFYKQVDLLKKCDGWQFKGLCLGGESEYFRDGWGQSIQSHFGYEYGIHPTNYSEQVISNYKHITISYGGDNFERGAVEKHFIKDLGNVVYTYHAPRIHTLAFNGTVNLHSGVPWLSLLHGKQTLEKTFKKTNDTLFKINQREFKFLSRTLTYQQAFPGNVFADIGSGPSYPYENAGVGQYEIRAKEIAMQNTVSIDYIDAIPTTWVGDTQEQIRNPHLYVGWESDDHDSDGTTNEEDEEYTYLIDNYNPSYNIDESTYRKVVTTTNYEYNSSYVTQPTKTIVATSNDTKTYETINRYLDERTTVADDTNTEIDELANYNTLEQDHRINSPIQTESYVNQDGNLTLLSKQKTIYESDANSNNHVLPRIIQTAKGNAVLEDRIRFEKYDTNGNLTEVRQVNGVITKYIYNVLNQVTQKIDNYKPPTGTFNTNDPNLPSLCDTIKQMYPNSQVTLYFYNLTTNLLTEIIDPRCNKISYEYDAHYRLKYVKDQDGNILSKNEYNYTTQN